MKFFPYDNIRPEQDKFIEDIEDALKHRKNLIAHAPTGLGKTAAVLAPALEYALNNKKKVFFLTSRNTQHKIAVETLRSIKKKGASFSAIDMVGKKNMCAREEAEEMKTNFYVYCDALKKTSDCDYYKNFKSGDSFSEKTEKLANILSSHPTHSQETVVLGRNIHVCPYEVAAHASKNASVIISDYNYVFNPYIRDRFFEKNLIDLNDVIVIVDEGHNLPDRIREIFTVRINNFIIESALKEAYELKENGMSEFLKTLENGIKKLTKSIPPFEQEMRIKKEDLMDKISDYSIGTVLEKIEEIESKSANKEQGFLGLVGEFLKAWSEESDEEIFLRVISIEKKNREVIFEILSTCLDPSVESSEVIKQAHSVIMMSGTLQPTKMFRDVLGFPEDTAEKIYKDPMPRENKLSVCIGGVTTKYSQRSEEEYEKIGRVCSEVSGSVPGNTIIFFPSYKLMEQIAPFIKTEKEVIKEKQKLSKQEKDSILSEFKRNSGKGNVLLAVIGANFSEGVDLPGNFLKAVVIIGIPLQPLDLKTKSLISYYERKYRKGWEYGYNFPAFTKVMQAAGRCIRTETDRGIIAFVDQRYMIYNYKKYFPRESIPRPIANSDPIKDFFYESNLN